MSKPPRPDKSTKARECKKVLIRLPPDEHHALRVIAALDNISMAAWVERVVRPMIQSRKKKLD